MESTMQYENAVLEPPTQFKIGGQGNKTFRKADGKDSLQVTNNTHV